MVEEKNTGFSAEERAAMKEHAKELKRASRKGTAEEKAARAAQDVLDKIAEMDEPDRTTAKKVHDVILASAPALQPKLWYGMPSYSLAGQSVCFFQAAAKFNARYSTLGFNDPANLDDGEMWPTAFAVREVTPAVEKRIGELIRKAVS